MRKTHKAKGKNTKRFQANASKQGFCLLLKHPRSNNTTNLKHENRIERKICGKKETKQLQNQNQKE